MLLNRFSLLHLLCGWLLVCLTRANLCCYCPDCVKCLKASSDLSHTNSCCQTVHSYISRSCCQTVHSYISRSCCQTVHSYISRSCCQTVHSYISRSCCQTVHSSGMSFCRGSVNCHGSDGQMYHFCESSRSGEILLDQYRGGGVGVSS